MKAYSQLQGFRYKEVPINRAISLWADLRALWATMCYIRRNGIGIVTGHTPKGGIVAMTAAWLCRVPSRIYFRHGLVYETQTGLKRRFLMTIDRIAAGFATDVVCVSESVRKRSLEDRLGAARKQKILHNGTFKHEINDVKKPVKAGKKDVEISPLDMGDIDAAIKLLKQAKMFLD